MISTSSKSPYTLPTYSDFFVTSSMDNMSLTYIEFFKEKKIFEMNTDIFQLNLIIYHLIADMGSREDKFSTSSSNRHKVGVSTL